LIGDYLRMCSSELGERTLESFAPLHSIDEPPSTPICKLLRKPYPAQTLAIMGLVRRWQQARAGAVIAECGTGKTLISLAAVQTHADDRPFTALAMVPPQLVEKWCREAILIPARPGMVIRRPWLSTSRTPPATPAPRPHLDFQTPSIPSRRPSNSLLRKTLVIFGPIQNTLDLHPVASWGICVSSHYPSQDSDRMRRAYPLALTRLFRFFLPTDSAQEPRNE